MTVTLYAPVGCSLAVPTSALNCTISVEPASAVREDRVTMVRLLVATLSHLSDTPSVPHSAAVSVLTDRRRAPHSESAAATDHVSGTLADAGVNAAMVSPPDVMLTADACQVSE